MRDLNSSPYKATSSTPPGIIAVNGTPNETLNGIIERPMASRDSGVSSSQSSCVDYPNVKSQDAVTALEDVFSKLNPTQTSESSLFLTN